MLNCLYIDIMGLGQADGISVFSILMTLFGIFANVFLVFFGCVHARVRLAHPSTEQHRVCATKAPDVDPPHAAVKDKGLGFI